MKGKKKQYRFVVKRWESMIDRLHAYKDSQSPEDLHKIRVDIKKIRALLALYKDDFSKNDLQPLKDLFKDTGMVRDAYVQLKLIEKYQSDNKNLEDAQRHLLNDLSLKFSSQIDFHIKETQELYTQLLNHLHTLEKRYLTHAFKKQSQKIEQIFKEDDPATLHTNRKRIKRLMYMYPLFEKELPAKWELNTSYLDKLQDTIGKWHDAKMVVPSLAGKGMADEKISHQIIKRISGLEKKIGSLSKDFKNKATS